MSFGNNTCRIHAFSLSPEMYSSMRLNSIVCCGLFACLLVGCGEESFPPPPPPVLSTDTVEPVIEKTVAVDVHLPGERKAFDGLKFAVPASWEEVALSDFQKGVISAKFTMPQAGSDVTLTLSRSGGGIEANLSRWRGQITAARPEVTDNLSVAGVDATLIDMEGRFSGGFGKDPQDGWRMVGIIVPLSDQGYFLKLTGPVAEVAAVEEEFRNFAKSATQE